MIVDRTEINAGAMKFGSSAEFNVVLRNNSEDVVRVTSVRKSCTCTEATLEGPSVLKPGEVSMVKLKITPGSTGLFSRQALVDYTRKDMESFTDTITLKATVIE